MRAYILSLALLTLLATSLSTALEPWFRTWQGNRAGSDDLLEVALGDSRRLFSQHFFAKADDYFHSGLAPTIFDTDEGKEHSNTAVACDGESKLGFLGPPRDWIDRFSRNFYPTRHKHLGEHTNCQGHEHDHEGHQHHDHETPNQAIAGSESEMLPWLQLSVKLDPHRIESYVLGAYWLRTKLRLVDEAERFLRAGLQANPGNSEILLELGLLYYDDRKDVHRARNVLEFSLRQYQEHQATQPDIDPFFHIRLLNQLARLEREQNNKEGAMRHYVALREISPNKQKIQEWIDWLQTNTAPTLEFSFPP